MRRPNLGTVPSAEAVAAMMKYNEQLQKAGVLLALDGLHPPSMGARVTFAGGKAKVTDGPFTEAKEVVGGYWMIQVKSRGGSDRMGYAVPGRRLHHRGSAGAGDVRFSCLTSSRRQTGFAEMQSGKRSPA